MWAEDTAENRRLVLSHKESGGERSISFSNSSLRLALRWRGLTIHHGPGEEVLVEIETGDSGD